MPAVLKTGPTYTWRFFPGGDFNHHQ